MSDEGGKPTEASVFWRRLRDCSRRCSRHAVPREKQAPRDIGRIATPAATGGELDAVAREEDGGMPRREFDTRGIERVVSEPSVPAGGASGEPDISAADPDPRALLYQWLATRYPCPGRRRGRSPDAFGTVISSAWKALSYSNAANCPRPQRGSCSPRRCRPAWRRWRRLPPARSGISCATACG